MADACVGNASFLSMTAILVFLSSGCSSSDSCLAVRVDGGISGTGQSRMTTIGPAGGTVSLDEFTAIFPEGALSSQTNVKITSLRCFTADFGVFSATYRLAPSGLTTMRPFFTQVRGRPGVGNSRPFQTEDGGAFAQISDSCLTPELVWARVSTFDDFVIGGRFSHDTQLPDGGKAPCPPSNWAATTP